MLENLKLLLGIPADDTTLDAKLNLILTNTTARLTLLLGGSEPPEEMNHIVLEVAVMRFNRIGSEGYSSHTEEGASQTFSENDFAPFADEIKAWMDAQEVNVTAKVRFI